MGWSGAWGEEEGFPLGYVLLRRAWRGDRCVMHGEGKSTPVRSQIEHTSFLTFKGEDVKTRELPLQPRRQYFQIWKGRRRRRGAARHLGEWLAQFSAAGFSEKDRQVLLLQRLDLSSQTGFISINRMMWMCLVCWGILHTGLRIQQENLPLITYALAWREPAECREISLSCSANARCASASALYK